jgi:hypothetical protein
MVNTFCVSADPRVCAKSLDYRRLGRQRVEAHQIWKAVTGVTQGWRNHPAARMWQGHADALAAYANAMVEEWVERGYKNTMQRLPTTENPEFPWWWGWQPLLFSHMASLNRKDPCFYSFEVPADYAAAGYVWPHSVGEHLRGRPDVEASAVCAAPAAPIKKRPRPAK